MTISVVQTMTGPSPLSTTYTGDFGSNVTAANTILLAATTFSGSNVTFAASAPTFNGGSVTGAAKLAEVQAAYNGSFTSYVTIWMLPVVAGGATSVGLTVANANTSGNSQIGLLGWEVAGLGPSPALDQSSTSSGASTSATSGTSGATTQAAEFILGVLMGVDGLPNTPGQPAGYTNINIGGAGFASAGGYQIQSSSGSTYTYATANGGTNTWAGALVTITLGGSTNASAGNAASSGAIPAAASAVRIGMTIRGS